MTISTFVFKEKKVHMNGLDFSQVPKDPSLGPFWGILGPPNLQSFFKKNWALSLPLIYDYLTLCKKSEENGDSILCCSKYNFQIKVFPLLTIGQTNRAKL